MANVKINSEKLRKALEDFGIPITRLSSMVLNRCNSYISGCLKDQSMAKEDFESLCKFINVKAADYVLTEPSPITKAVEKKVEKVSERTVEAIDYNNKIDTLIVGLNVLYEEQSNTNQLLTQLLQEIKVSNAKFDRMEKRVGSIDNASGQILSKVIGLKEHGEEVDDALVKIKSALNTISGRAGDISKSLDRKDSVQIRAVK